MIVQAATTIGTLAAPPLEADGHTVALSQRGLGTLEDVSDSSIEFVSAPVGIVSRSTSVRSLFRGADATQLNINNHVAIFVDRTLDFLGTSIVRAVNYHGRRCESHCVSSRNADSHCHVKLAARGAHQR
jgi:hypothetical protein